MVPSRKTGPIPAPRCLYLSVRLRPSDVVVARKRVARPRMLTIPPNQPRDPAGSTAKSPANRRSRGIGAWVHPPLRYPQLAGRTAKRHDAVREIDGLFDVVGHEEHGFAGAFAGCATTRPAGLAGHRVERAERLVHQQHVRLDREGTSQGNALALAARQLVRIAVGIGGETDKGQRALARSRRSARGNDERSRPKPTLDSTLRQGSRRPSWNTRATGSTAPGFERRDIDQALARLRQARDHSQEGRLADAGMADDGHELTLGDIEVEPTTAPRSGVLREHRTGQGSGLRSARRSRSGLPRENAPLDDHENGIDDAVERLPS